MKCPTCGKVKRSSEANRRYWKLIHLISENIKPNGSIYKPETWHIYHKGRYLGMNDITLPSGQVITIPQSTTDLDSVDFSNYMQNVEVWAAEHGVYLDE